MRIQDFELEKYELSAKAVLVFSNLLSHMNYKTGECWPSLKLIAKECKLSVSSVQRGLKELLTAGLVKKSSRYRSDNSQTSNLYTIITKVADRTKQAAENMLLLLNQRKEYIKSRAAAQVARAAVAADEQSASAGEAKPTGIFSKILSKLNSPRIQFA